MIKNHRKHKPLLLFKVTYPIEIMKGYTQRLQGCSWQCCLQWEIIRNDFACSCNAIPPPPAAHHPVVGYILTWTPVYSTLFGANAPLFTFLLLVRISSILQWICFAFVIREKMFTFYSKESPQFSPFCHTADLDGFTPIDLPAVTPTFMFYVFSLISLWAQTHPI